MRVRLSYLARGPALPLVLGGALGLVSFTVNLLRQLSYHSPAYDLGFFDQLCWRQAHGYGLTSSFTDYPFLGQHWEPVLLALCQPYHLSASPLWLYGLSAIALALTPLAAYALARAWLGPEGWSPTIAAAATAISPLLIHAGLYDFHPEVLTPLLALTALWGAARRRWLVTLACCVVLALVKEDALLVVAGTGWLMWRAGGHRRGLAIAAAAMVGFVLIIGVIMPAIRGGAPGDLASRYAYLAGSSGATTGDIVGGMIRHPMLWLDHLASKTTLGAVALTLLPLALLPLLSGWALPAAVPVVLIALLSTQPEQAELHLHYGVQAFPLLLATALLGWRRLRQTSLPTLASRRWLVPGAATAALVFAILVLPGDGNWASANLIGGLQRRAAVQSVLGQLDPTAPVAATSNLVAQVSHRKEVWEFPGPGRASWVLIDTQGSPTLQSLAAGYEQRRAGLPTDGFRMVASGGGVTLWHRP